MTTVTIAEQVVSVTVDETDVTVTITEVPVEIEITAGATVASVAAVASDLSDHEGTIASGVVLGHVKVGANLTIDLDGTLNADAGGAADVDDLTTATGNSGEMVRVAAAGGLEYRTTGQVLADIGAAAAADLTNHEADTTSVHGIADTSLLETTAGAQAKADVVQGNLDTHEADVTNPHAVTAAQAGALAIANNLSDLNDAPTARTNLGLGSAALSDAGDFAAAVHTHVAADIDSEAATDGWVLTADGLGGAAWEEATGGGASLPVADTTAIVEGSADATKLLRFEVDGFATGTTRVLTPPDSDGTIAVLGLAQTWSAEQAFTATQNFTGFDTAGDVVLNLGDNWRLKRYQDNTAFNIGDYAISAKDNTTFIDIIRFSYFGIEILKTPLKIENIHLAVDVADISTADLSLIFGTSGGSSAQYAFRVKSENRILKFQGDHKNIGPTWPRELMAIDNATGRIGFGHIAPTSRLHPIESDAVTATTTDIVTLGHNSTGTPAAGFGAALAFQLESSTTNSQNAGRLAAVWNVATHASRAADLVAYASDSAAEREIWRGRANGSAAAVGFLGATPIARQAHIVDADGTLADVSSKFNTLLSYLESFGFIATS